MGMQPVTVLQDLFNQKPQLCALRREVLSQLSTDRLSLVGQDLIHRGQGQGQGFASPDTDTPSEADLKAFVSLGLDAMLAGGPATVAHLSIDEIRDLALAVRRKGAATRQARAEHMGLCVPGAKRGSMIYSLGLLASGGKGRRRGSE